MTMRLKVISALLYATFSVLIMVTNKTILSSYKFPSPVVLGIGQMVVTVFSMELGRRLRLIDFPPWSISIPFQIFPLPFFYLGNLCFGLVGTGAVSLPMFTVLRRFSNLFILVAESVLLRQTIRLSVLTSVLIMISGAVVAALDDLSFDARGYAFIMLNNVCTMGYGVTLKMKLTSSELNKYALLYYNAAFMLPPALLVARGSGQAGLAWQFRCWACPGFLGLFLTSCLLGVVLLYCTALCTQHNSALATAVIGVMKNISVTYIGMFVGGDYTFTVVNFLGLNISALGAIYYGFVTFRGKPSASSGGNDLTKVVSVKS